MGTYNLNAAHAVGDAGFTNAFNAAAAAINDLDSRVTSANTAIGNSLQTNEIAVAPNTELSLTGAGTVASPLTIGSATIVGAGRPDVAASMTTAVQAQVAAAPVGSTFSSTDGASVGAWAWQKQPSGWIVSSLDTRWRDITPLLTGGATATKLHIKRVTDEVRIRVSALTTTGTGIILAGQTGFEVSNGAYLRFPMLMSGSTTSWTQTLLVTPTGGLQALAVGTSTGDAVEIRWDCNSSAPTSLPGTAV